MKKLINYLKQKYNKINILLILILLLSLFAIVDIRLRFIEIPEIFKGGNLFETDIYNISVAYIASFIFFLLISYIPNLQKRKKFIGYVSNQIKDILIISSDVVESIANNSNIGKPFCLPTKNELEEMLKTVKTTDMANRGFFTSTGMREYTVWEIVMQCRSVVLTNINKLSVRTPEYDEDLTALLMKVEGCTFFFILEQTGIDFNSSNLEILSKSFNEYLDLLIELSDYTNIKYDSPKFEEMFNEIGLPKRQKNSRSTDK